MDFVLGAAWAGFARHVAVTLATCPLLCLQPFLMTGNRESDHRGRLGGRRSGVGGGGGVNMFVFFFFSDFFCGLFEMI